MKNRKIFKFKDSIPNEYFKSLVEFVAEQMSDIEYGMFDENGKEITDPDRYYEDTRIQEAEWVMKNKCGNCVDQANLEYWFFKENQVKTSLYCIEYTTEEKITPSHMFVVVENQHKFYWFENAWKNRKGFWEYNSLDECLNDVKYSFCPYDYLDNCKICEIEELIEGSNPNTSLKIKETKKISKPKLYYLSREELKNSEIIPSIPNNFLTEYGYADTIQERVVLFPSIEQALSNQSGNLQNFSFCIYTPEENIDYYKPSVLEVPTVNITGECWSYDPVKMKLVGKIKVGTPIPNSAMAYSYGNGLNDKLQKWNYDIIDGNVIKDSWDRIQSIQELERVLKNSHPNWSKEKIYTVSYKLHYKQLKEQEEKNAQKTQKKPIDNRKYVVINRYGEEKFSGLNNACQEFIKENGTDEFTTVDEETYKKLSYSEIKELFEDSKPRGIHIEFCDSKEFEGCIEVNVVDYDNSNNILDQEICYNMKEVRYIIDSYKLQYKIKKIEKRGND